MSEPLLIIHKQVLTLTNDQVLSFTGFHKALSLQFQPIHGALVFWYLVDIKDKTESRRFFHIRGTGHTLNFDKPLDDYDFLGTAQDNRGLVWHVWMRKEPMNEDSYD